MLLFYTKLAAKSVVKSEKIMWSEDEINPVHVYIFANHLIG